MNSWNDSAAFLEHRAYAYLLFKTAIGNEPTGERVSLVCGKVSQDVLKCFVMARFPEYSEALAPLVESMARIMQRIEGDSPSCAIQELKDEYTRLYLNPEKLEAPPWESMYTSNEKVLFQERTLIIRNIYRENGFLPADYPSVADDHLALELAFMAKLGERAKASFANGEEPLLLQDLAVSRSFLEEHLLLWTPLYVSDLLGASPGGFYPCLAKVALEFMKIDHDILESFVRSF